MPQFLEEKLKRRYGRDSSMPYKIMNARGYMRGNKVTEKGREAQRKHDRDMRRSGKRSRRRMKRD